MKKLLVALLVLVFSLTAMAEWNFRGTANSWVSEGMYYNSGTGLYEVTKTFENNDPRFKIDRYGDWTESYPAQDYTVDGNKTYTITFNPSTHEINAIEKGIVDNWYFRGSSNAWIASEMTLNESTGLYEISQTFANGDGGGGPRFKISHDINWGENYPSADYTVDGNASYLVTFNASTKVIVATLDSIDPPVAPTGLTVSGIAQTSMSINWNAVSSASSYEVFKALSSNGTYTSLETVSGTNYTVTGLLSGTNYYFKVSASNAAGTSAKSSAVLGTTSTVEIPVAPTGLTVSGINETSLTVNWNTVNGASSYEIFKASSSNGTYTSLETVSGTSYTVTGLTAGTTYYFKATASNTAGTSVKSNSVLGTTSSEPSDTWYFRGTANSWIASLMEDKGNGIFEIVQVFSNGDSGGEPRFKISHDTSWGENYPAQDYTVDTNKTYTVRFDANSKEITAIEAESTDVTVSADPGSTTTTDQNVSVTLKITGKNATGKYSYGENNAQYGTVYTDGQVLNISLANVGDEVKINLYGENTDSTDATSYTYKRTDDTVSEDIDSLRIYQVMVESFIDGDSNANYNTGYGPSHHRGDLRGIINSLPYMKDLGMNAVWMTPIFNSEGGSQLDATGYFTKDYFAVDPKFGSFADAKELVEKAHALGMYVFLDGVFGHHKGNAAASPSGKTPQGGSDPVDYNQNETLEFYKEVATYWIDEIEIDGWRLDQAYQVPIWAWEQIRQSVEAKCSERKSQGKQWGTLGYMVGEIWKGADEIQTTGYGGNGGSLGLYSNFDFPLRYNAVQVFAAQEHTEQAGAMGQPASHLNSGYASHDTYASHAHPNFMITNHDLVRFGDLIQRGYGYGKENADYWKRHKAVFSFQAAFTGPITIYYGDEIGDEVGGFVNEGDGGYWDDHVSRSSGQVDNFDYNQNDLKNYVKDLMRVRNEHSSLWNGSRTNLIADQNIYADLKVDGSDKTVYVVNSSTDGNSASLSQGSIGGSKLVDAISGETVYSSGGNYNVSLDGLTGKIFIVE